jgi:FlaA1/EpsC-like NDP-sugar epimerase
MSLCSGAIKYIKITARATRLRQRLYVFSYDFFIAAISFPLSVFLRLGDDAFGLLIGPLLLPWIVFTLVCGIVFWFSRVPLGVWRYTSLDDIIIIAKVVTMATLFFLLATFIITRLDEFHRSTLVINWMVLSALMTAPRLAARLRADGTLRNLFVKSTFYSRTPILLVGVGDSADLFLREVTRDPNAQYQVLGLVSDDETQAGLSMHGRPILGMVEELPQLLERLAASDRPPQRLIITQTLQRDMMQELLKVAEAANISVARLRRLTEFKNGANSGLEIRPIAIDDLLGRTQKKLDHAAMRRQIEGRRVLITGAGGSIGSELVRQVAALFPSHIVLLDSSESHLYQIDIELHELRPDLSRSAILADVRDLSKLHQVMLVERPSLVFHAAALKHVPLVEANCIEGVLTNTIGTRNVANACRNAGVEAMVLISTDKAVNPSSMMGATKRLAEEYCQALNVAGIDVDHFGVVPKKSTTKRRNTRFFTVRFGNVLGSNGSVVPLFERQLAAGGPLTITHPDMCRYFMTIREAVELVLQALAIGIDESNDVRDSIYVLDMGKPMKIVDLAQQMIRLAGLIPGEDVQIKITGLRPGEKLSEELFHDAESLRPTMHPGLHLATPRHADLKTVNDHIDLLTQACRQLDKDKVDWLMREFVAEFRVSMDNSQIYG